MNFDSIRKSFVHVFGGNVLTEDFFSKNLTFIVVLVSVVILFISQRYTVLQKISELERLKVELKDARFESLNISSDLTEMSRQGEVERMIQQYGLDLEVTSEPVFKIQKNKK